MSSPASSSKKHRIVVGLSGGVDSAVSAHLLKQQGHEVVGIFMKNWEDDDDSEYCSSNVDFVDAAAVALDHRARGGEPAVEQVDDGRHHPERGPMSVDLSVRMSAGHDLNHLGQLERLL